MGILSWLIFGFLAGILAKLVMPGRDRSGFLFTVVLGIFGAAVGGWIGTQFGWGTVRGFDLRSLGLAVLGGVVVLALYRALTR
ncbi:MAG: GlsB/YeaQ/YmgE family stress response membrane protein [Candidatus Binatia bacterium]